MNKEQQSVNSGLVKSAGRTLDLLELLSRHPRGLTLSEIGSKLEIPLSSLHNLCNTLVNRGYLVRDRTNAFQLGPKIGQIKATYHENVNLILLADEQMEKITKITGETTSLAVLQGATTVFIHKRPGEGILQVINPVGTRLLAHCTGSGKIMLSYLVESEIDQLYSSENIEAMTPNSFRTKSELKAELKRISKLGYAFNNQESETGVWALAGCIRDQNGGPIASISIVAPSARISLKDHDGWEYLVRDACKEISYRLGFQGDA